MQDLNGQIAFVTGAHFAGMLAAFGVSADPSYPDDDIAGLVAANGAQRMNVVAAQ